MMGQNLETKFVLQERAMKETSPAFRLAVYLYPWHKPWRTDPDTLRKLDKIYQYRDRDALRWEAGTPNNLVADIASHLLDDDLNREMTEKSNGKIEYVRPWWAGFPSSFSIEKGMDRQKIVESMVREG